MSARGFTLIEHMMSIAMIGIASSMVFASFSTYQRATTRALEIEGLARVLDIEMERMRACATSTCLRRLEARTSTTAGLDAASGSWVRAHVRRVVRDGPEGTFRVVVSATVPGHVEEKTVGALLRVEK